MVFLEILHAKACYAFDPRHSPIETAAIRDNVITEAHSIS